MMSLLRGVVAMVAGSVLLLTALGAWAGAEGGPPEAGSGEPAAKLTTVRGVVKAVEGSTLSVEVSRSAEEDPLVLALDEKTVVLKKRKRISAGAIQVGDAVTVRYDERDGQAIAKRIWVRTGSSAAE